MSERNFFIDKNVGDAQSRFDSLIAQGVDRNGSQDCDGKIRVGKLALFCSPIGPDGVLKTFDYSAILLEPRRGKSVGVGVLAETIIGRNAMGYPPELVTVVTAVLTLEGTVVNIDERPYDDNFEDRLIQLIEETPKKSDFIEADLGVRTALGIAV